MIKYHPYKRNKSGKNTKLSQKAKQKKKYILGLVVIVILQSIRMDKESKDILIDTTIMKIGLKSA